MIRRPDPAPAPPFLPSDMYRLLLLGEARYEAERGPIPPELMMAVWEREERQRRQSEAPRHRATPEWPEDLP